jgi:hypothetical protein
MTDLAALPRAGRPILGTTAGLSRLFRQERRGPLVACDKGNAPQRPSPIRSTMGVLSTESNNVDHGLTLASVLLFGSGLFCLSTLFFGTKGGFYDSDDYDGNGTAH